MPETTFFLQEEARCSARVRIAIDSGEEAASTAEHNTDYVARRTIEEVANSKPQCCWLLAWVSVLFVYRQQLICIDAL